VVKSVSFYLERFQFQRHASVWATGTSGTSGFVNDVMCAHSRPKATQVGRLLKVTHQGAVPDRVRSLMSMIDFV